MITALATVVSVQYTPQGNNVKLSCEQRSSCNHCSSQKACGIGTISKMVNRRTHSWSLLTKTPLKQGQIVEIGFPEKKLIQFASIVYLFPLIMLMIGAGVGQFLMTFLFNGEEGGVIFLSFLFMVIGIWFARYILARLQLNSEPSISLLRVLGDEVEISSN